MTETNEKCIKCTKDFTKCGTCTVMMNWVREMKKRNSK